MNFKIYSSVIFFLLLIAQISIAQTEKPLNNGRTPADIARRAAIPKIEKPSTILPKARNEEEGLDKDEGKYERSDVTNFTENLTLVRTELETIAKQYETLQLSAESYQSELENIKKSLDLCCGGGSLGDLTIGIDIDETSAYLLQNAPNPFNQITQIQYFIPQKGSCC